jgi:heptosyltransferase-3
VGFVDASGLMASIKRAALSSPVEVRAGIHRVDEVLRLAQALSVPPVGEIVPPQGDEPARPRQRYAVVHAMPMFRYKRWTEEGWRGLAKGLAARGLSVVATGGPDEADRRYLDGLWSTSPDIERLDGALSWPALAGLIGGAEVYVGPDTSVTHLAAATGTSTVALYGPTDPRLWGPWPAGGLAAPWAAAGTIQNRGNVWLVQNPLPCLPCQQEGCLRRLDSHSQCLDELRVEQVLGAVDAALAGATPGSRYGGAQG